MVSVVYIIHTPFMIICNAQVRYLKQGMCLTFFFLWLYGVQASDLKEN